MLKLGKLADYATTLMTALAADPDKVASAQELAARTHVAQPTVAKLLKLLTKGGLVEATRGAQGGYRLAKAADAITVMDVIAAIEGPISLTECATHKGQCAIEPHCGTRSNWKLINQVVRRALDSVSLQQMTHSLRRHPGESRDPGSHVLAFHKTRDSGLRRNDR